MTLQIFQTCEKSYDWKAYIRIGLYYVLRNGKRRNFCDIHLGWYPTEAVERGIYSGPSDSINQITRYVRTTEAISRYKSNQKVTADLDVSAGGVAKIVQTNDRKTTDIWLFGPLLIEGVAYGSLVAEFDGLVWPKAGTKRTPIDPKTGEKRKTGDPKAVRYWAIYPRNYTSAFRPCKLWGSSYSEGTQPWAPPDDNIDWEYSGGSTVHYKEGRAPGEAGHTRTPSAPGLPDALKNARASLASAFLPNDATKVEWKIEDFASGLTECEVFARGG